MDPWGNVMRVLKVYTGGMVLGKEMQKKEDCWNLVMKNSWALQTFGFYETGTRKITYSAGGCETETDFVLVRET